MSWTVDMFARRCRHCLPVNELISCLCSPQHGSRRISQSPYCPLHRGLTAQQQHASDLQPPGHQTSHHLWWDPSKSTPHSAELQSHGPSVLHINDPSSYCVLSGLQQFGRLLVLHQRSSVCGVSPRHGHGFLSTRESRYWARCSRSRRRTQQPALHSLWDVSPQHGGVHHFWSSRAAWGDPDGGEGMGTVTHY